MVPAGPGPARKLVKYNVIYPLTTIVWSSFGNTCHFLTTALSFSWLLPWWDRGLKPLLYHDGILHLRVRNHTESYQRPAPRPSNPMDDRGRIYNDKDCAPGRYRFRPWPPWQTSRNPTAQLASKPPVTVGDPPSPLSMTVLPSTNPSSRSRPGVRAGLFGIARDQRHRFPLTTRERHTESATLA